MLVLHPEIASLWRHYRYLEEDYSFKAMGYDGAAASAQDMADKNKFHRLSWTYRLASWEAEQIAHFLKDLYYPGGRNGLLARKHPMSRSAHEHVSRIFARPDVQIWLRKMNRRSTFEHVMSVIDSVVADYDLEDWEEGKRTLAEALDLPMDVLGERERKLRDEVNGLDPDQYYPRILLLYVYELVREHKVAYCW